MQLSLLSRRYLVIPLTILSLVPIYSVYHLYNRRRALYHDDPEQPLIASPSSASNEDHAVHSDFVQPSITIFYDAPPTATLSTTLNAAAAPSPPPNTVDLSNTTIDAFFPPSSHLLAAAAPLAALPH